MKRTSSRMEGYCESWIGFLLLNGMEVDNGEVSFLVNYLIQMFKRKEIVLWEGKDYNRWSCCI